MNNSDKFNRMFNHFLWTILSVPIYIKILGIGFGVAIIFGTVAFYQIRAGLYNTHYKVHGEMALSVATAVATRISPLVAENDIPAVDRELATAIESFPDVRYIVVQDEGKHILSHGYTFPAEAPPDLLMHGGDFCASCHSSLSSFKVPRDLIEIPPKTTLPTGQLKAYIREGGLVLEVVVLIPGTAGTIRLGIGDKIIKREMASVTSSLLVSLVLCVLIGFSLALVLGYVLVRPIHNLVQATKRIRKEEFDARAEVFCGDEIGRLAIAFNEMADGLEAYQKEVEEKDRARVSLIGKIVQAQEDERKVIARELHDQMGQSLSNALLTIESHCKGCIKYDKGRCEPIKDNIRNLIDDVRRLAWDFRPSILDDYGVDHALSRYVEEISKRAEFSIDYQCVAGRDSKRLPSSIEVTLYRIAQEAVTNIIRHADAQEVSVILLRHGYQISLIVEDDGKGFDMGEVESGSGTPLGLIGMKERAALVGGEFAIDSHPGKGTTVRIIIPLDEVDDGNPDNIS